MEMRKAEMHEYEAVRSFYWEVIDLMQDRTDTVGWKKGIYPSDRFLEESIENGELYVLERSGAFAAAVIVNGSWNPGYEGLPWKLDCRPEAVLVPHALAVHPSLQGRGIGKLVMKNVVELARELGKLTVRLDILIGNLAAERLYSAMGFQPVGENVMFYEDTGWTRFRMYELVCEPIRS